MAPCFVSLGDDCIGSGIARGDSFGERRRGGEPPNAAIFQAPHEVGGIDSHDGGGHRRSSFKESLTLLFKVRRFCIASRRWNRRSPPLQKFPDRRLGIRIASRRRIGNPQVYL